MVISAIRHGLTTFSKETLAISSNTRKLSYAAARKPSSTKAADEVIINKLGLSATISRNGASITLAPNYGLYNLQGERVHEQNKPLVTISTNEGEDIIPTTEAVKELVPYLQQCMRGDLSRDPLDRLISCKSPLDIAVQRWKRQEVENQEIGFSFKDNREVSYTHRGEIQYFSTVIRMLMEAARYHRAEDVSELVHGPVPVEGVCIAPNGGIGYYNLGLHRFLLTPNGVFRVPEQSNYHQDYFALNLTKVQQEKYLNGLGIYSLFQDADRNLLPAIRLSMETPGIKTVKDCWKSIQEQVFNKVNKSLKERKKKLFIPKKL